MVKKATFNAQMTLAHISRRDFFAGCALIGLLGTIPAQSILVGASLTGVTCAEYCFDLADKLIEASGEKKDD